MPEPGGPYCSGEGLREIGEGLLQTLTRAFRRGAGRGVTVVRVVTVSPSPAAWALLEGVGCGGMQLPAVGAGDCQTVTTVTNPHPPG